MRIIFFLLSLFLLFFPAVNIFAVDHLSKKSSRTLDLQSAIQYAIVNSPVLDSIRRFLNISELNFKNSKANFLPSIDLSSNHLLQKDQESELNGALNGVAATLTENLYDNGISITNYKINRLNRDIALLQYKDAQDQLVRIIADDFLNLSLQKKLYEIQKSNFDILNGQYKSALKKYYAGLTTPKDISRFLSQVQIAEISLSQVLNSIELAKKQLLADIGVAPDVDQDEKIYFKIIKLGEIDTTLLPIAMPSLFNQYQYKTFLLQKKINLFNIDLARRQYLPEINLSANAFYGNGAQIGFLSAYENKKTWNMSASLDLKYNLFDAGTRRHNVVIAKEQNLQSIDDLKQQLIAIKQAITNLMLSFEQSKKSYKISVELRKTQMKNYQNLNRMYREGKISYLDLTTAISDLLNAETQYLNDRYSLEKDLYDYYYYQKTIIKNIFANKMLFEE